MIHSSLKRFFRHFDWLGFGLTIALLTFGLSMVFSATFTPMTPISSFLKRQAFGACSGLALYLVVAAIDPRLVIALGFIGYHGALALLCYTLLTASPTLGAQRWMSIYFFKFQPSELAKLFFPFFLGHLLQSSSSSARTTDAPTNRFFYYPNNHAFDWVWPNFQTAGPGNRSNLTIHWHYFVLGGWTAYTVFCFLGASRHG